MGKVLVLIRNQGIKMKYLILFAMTLAVASAIWGNDDRSNDGNGNRGTTEPPAPDRDDNGRGGNGNRDATVAPVPDRDDNGRDGSGGDQTCTIFYNFPHSCATIRSQIESTVNGDVSYRSGEDFSEYFVVESSETRIHLSRFVASYDPHMEAHMTVFGFVFELRQTEDSNLCLAMGTAQVHVDGMVGGVAASDVYCTMQNLVVDAELATGYQDYQATTGDLCPGVSRTPGGAGCSSGTAPESYGPSEFNLADVLARGMEAVNPHVRK